MRFSNEKLIERPLSMIRYFNPASSAPYNTLITVLVSIMLLLGAATSHGGIISSILKSAKKLDAPEGVPKSLSDINLSQLDIDLPHKGAPEVLSIKLDLNNQWVVKNADGKLVSNPAALKNPVLVIEKPNLPRDLNALASVVPGVPLLVRSGRNLYEVNRTGGISIRTGPVVMATPNMAAFHKALFHLDAPWYSHKVNVLGATQSQHQLGGNFKGIKSSLLSESPRMLRGQTLVLGGPIKYGKIQAAGESHNIADLKVIAKQYDISLILLESKKVISPEKIQARIQKMSQDGEQHSTGSFLSQFNRQGGRTFYQSHPDSKHYVLIQKERVPVLDQSIRVGDVAVEMATSMVIRGINIYRPNQDRQQELRRRWVWWLPSDVSFYLIISSFAGFISFGTCRSLMRKIWPTKPRSEFNLALTHYLFKGLRLVLLVLIIIPLFGLPCLIFYVLNSIYLLIKLIFIGLLKVIYFIVPGLKK